MPYKSESAFVRTMSDIHNTITSFQEHFPNNSISLVKISGYVSVKGEDCSSRKEYEFNDVKDIIGVMANVNLTEDWKILAPFEHSDKMLEQCPEMTEEWYDMDVCGTNITTRIFTLTSLDDEYLTEAGITEQYNKRGNVSIDLSYDRTDMDTMLGCL